MIGIVLVSHSKALAMAVRDLVAQMVGPDFPLAIAAGVGEDHDEIGTDAVHVAETLRPFCQGDGALVLMDLGSAVLSAQTALELLEMEGLDDPAARLRLCAAPIVEAAVAAAVQAKAGADLDTVAAEATAALAPKEAQLGPADAAPQAVPQMQIAGESCRTLDVVIDNAHGLHARPAASIVQWASRFQSDIQISNLTTNRGPASARSLTSIGLLQARKGEHVRFVLRGVDADAAAAALRALADDRFGEAGNAGTDAPTGAADGSFTEGQPRTSLGASEGVAIGRPLAIGRALPEAADGTPGTAEQETRSFDAAVRAVAEQIQSSAGTAGESADIVAAQALLLRDPSLIGAVHARLAQGNVTALAAWRQAIEAIIAAYAGLDDDYMRARAADLRDIADRVGRSLAGLGQAARIAPEPPAILLTDELMPSEAMACAPDRVLGVISRTGSPTAHAAIILRSLGIPMVVGGPSVDLQALQSATMLAIDGATGDIWTDPAGPVREDIETRRRAFLARRSAGDQVRDEPAVTLDGWAIDVRANVGCAADARTARRNGADGVGLLRTEFVYLPYRHMPSEEEQAAALAAVLADTGPGPIVVRTPDVGADKPLAFMPAATERNPFLGLRGLRLSFRHPAFFASNLRAILRAGHGRELGIMFPMVTNPDELLEARRTAEAAHADLERAGADHCWPVKLGMMIEVPSAALMIDRFVRHADFFSIGTNDLTQYVLAAERGNADLGQLQDAVHPAVLRVIHSICRQAGGRPVAVCGDAASDPLAAALMIGVGVRSLSVLPNQVATIKGQIRRLSLADLSRLAAEVMHCANSADVRRMANEFLAMAKDSGK